MHTFLQEVTLTAASFKINGFSAIYHCKSYTAPPSELTAKNALE